MTYNMVFNIMFFGAANKALLNAGKWSGTPDCIVFLPETTSYISYLFSCWILHNGHKVGDICMEIHGAVEKGLLSEICLSDKGSN